MVVVYLILAEEEHSPGLPKKILEYLHFFENKVNRNIICRGGGNTFSRKLRRFIDILKG